jgi:hypothetical protein
VHVRVEDSLSLGDLFDLPLALLVEPDVERLSGQHGILLATHLDSYSLSRLQTHIVYF